MPQHPNARLTLRGRAVLCERVGGGMRIADAAAMAGVSRQTAHKCVFVKTVVSWVARKTFRPGTASFHVRQGMPLSAFS